MSPVPQRNNYYPYGLPHAMTGLTIFDPTNTTTNPYKYGGKEFDTFGGTDTYDFGARHYNGAIPNFLSQDPLLEDYAGYSPYLYCGGNPIMIKDPSGLNWVYAQFGNDLFFFFHPGIKSQNDIKNMFGESSITYFGESGTATIGNLKTGETVAKLTLNKDGSYAVDDKSYSTDEEYDENSIHVGGVSNLKHNSPIRQKWFNSVYIGPKNPLQKNGQSSYSIPPVNNIDYAAFLHDRDYDAKMAAGEADALFNTAVAPDDAKLVERCILWADFNNPQERTAASRIILFFSAVTTLKVLSKILNH